LKKRLATFHTQLVAWGKIFGAKKKVPQESLKGCQPFKISWKKIAQKGKYAKLKISKEKINSFNIFKPRGV
jgi:hypothetical protein